MASGLFASDCSSTDWAWLDLGCIVQKVGGSVGQAAADATQPLVSQIETLFIIVAVFVVIIVALIAFSPNVKHVIPHLGFG
jgi:hypothetical protein